MLRMVKAYKRFLTPIFLLFVMSVSFLVPLQPPSNAQANDCLGNLVTNGNFSNGLVAGPLGGGGAVSNWTRAYGTPDVALAGHDPGSVGMWGNKNTTIGEGLQQNLGVNELQTGKTYLVSLWVKWVKDKNKQPYAKFKVRASKTALTSGAGGITVGVSGNINSPAWQQVNLPAWTAPAGGPFPFLTISVENNLSNDYGPDTSYGAVDNICIREAPSLPCCECLGQVTTLDLSTGQGGPADPLWTVNGGPAYTTSPHPAWTTSLTPPAKWIQPVASPTPANIPPGTYAYQVQFNIPECTIPSDVRVDIKWAADNSGNVFLDNNPTPVASCNPNTCFQTGVAQPFSLSNLGAGSHTLKFEVKNNEGPSGLIVDMKLTRPCARGNPGPTKNQTMEPRLKQ